MLAKIEGMKRLGFQDPVKMITRNPAILHLSIDNMKQKIEDMRQLGFQDPVKMISLAPAIL
jgi:hypothetical protein